MPTTINASTLTLDRVNKYLKFKKLSYSSFSSLLNLKPLTEAECSELARIKLDFENYLTDGKVLEGMVKALTVLLLIRLAGFYSSPIKMRMEQEIDRINVEDEDISITGRLDLICINKTAPNSKDIPFWILVIETKNSAIESLEGLPQLLTYSYQSLETQEAVWGLTTNGIRYDFVYLQKSIQNPNSATYQPLPSLNLIEPESAEKLLQVLKAICLSQNQLN